MSCRSAPQSRVMYLCVSLTGRWGGIQERRMCFWPCCLSSSACTSLISSLWVWKLLLLPSCSLVRVWAHCSFCFSRTWRNHLRWLLKIWTGRHRGWLAGIPGSNTGITCLSTWAISCWLERLRPNRVRGMFVQFMSSFVSISCLLLQHNLLCFFILDNWEFHQFKAGVFLWLKNSFFLKSNSS